MKTAMCRKKVLTYTKENKIFLFSAGYTTTVIAKDSESTEQSKKKFK